MTAEQWARSYAHRCNTSVKRLRWNGRVAIPCECSEPTCEGFQMSFPAEALFMRSRDWTPMRQFLVKLWMRWKYPLWYQRNRKAF